MKLQTCQFKDGDGWDNDPDQSLDSQNTLLLFFASPDNSAVELELEKLTSSFPSSIMIGCSSAGEIYDQGVHDNSIALSIVQFDQTQIRLANTDVGDVSETESAGRLVAQKLKHEGLRSVLILSDGLAVNGTKLIHGLSSELSDDVVITGGLAADADRFENTWVWSDGIKRGNHICAVGFYGDNFHVGHGSQGGWDVLGPEREVTRAVDNVLYELDAQPALDLYKKYLGDRAEGLPATGLLFPLAITNNDTQENDTVRTILAIDEEEHSITFAGDIPQGSYVRLMRANFDRLIDGAADAADAIDSSDYTSGPLLCIAISCVGRRLVLGPRTEEEIEAVQNAVPSNTDQIGFYSYGEISPLANGRCDLHNQTMTLTLFWED